MASPRVAITARDVEVEPKVREAVEARCAALADEFPEATHFEITLGQEGDDFVAHAHATGKGTEVASRAGAEELAPAADRALAALEKQLRRVHDKRIFAKRRDARRHPPKKG